MKINKLVFVIVSIFFVFVVSCKENNNNNERSLAIVKQKIADEGKREEQKKMVDLLFYEVKRNSETLWANDIVYDINNAQKDGESTIIFNNNVYIAGNTQNKKYSLESVVYRSGGFTGCEINNTTINQIVDRFGEPKNKEFNVKYVYKKYNMAISFLFDEKGILKNIVFNQ